MRKNEFGGEESGVRRITGIGGPRVEARKRLSGEEERNVQRSKAGVWDGYGLTPLGRAQLRHFQREHRRAVRQVQGGPLRQAQGGSGLADVACLCLGMGLVALLFAGLCLLDRRGVAVAGLFAWVGTGMVALAVALAWVCRRGAR